jgi:hypothetical protein
MRCRYVSNIDGSNERKLTDVHRNISAKSRSARPSGWVAEL